MSEFHEPPEDLTPESRDYRRALNTLEEEIQAIDWYQQRSDSTSNEQLKQIIEHNKLEEMEHAAMALEWLRRNMPGWDEKLRTYLFTEDNITELEEDDKESNGSENDEDLGIGKIE